MTGWETLTIGLPCASLPLMLPLGAGSLVSSWTVLGKTIGANRMANWPRPKVVARRMSGSPCWGVARPVVGSMLPCTKARSDTDTSGRKPPFCCGAAVGQRTVVGGGEERPRRAAIERAVDPGVGRDVEHRMGTGAGGVGDDVVPVGLDPRQIADLGRLLAGIVECRVEDREQVAGDVRPRRIPGEGVADGGRRRRG